MSIAKQQRQRNRTKVTGTSILSATAKEIDIHVEAKRHFLRKLRVKVSAGTITTVRVLEKAGVAAGDMQELASYSPAAATMSETEDLFVELDDTKLDYVSDKAKDWGGNIIVEVTGSNAGTADVQYEYEPSVDRQPKTNVTPFNGLS
jgi:hypothetical protein